MGTARRLTTTAMRSPCITCSTISVEFIRHCAALQQWKPDSAITFGRLRKWYFWRDNRTQRETSSRCTSVASASLWRALRYIPSKPVDAYLLEHETAISLRRQHYDSRKDQRQKSKLRHYPKL